MKTLNFNELKKKLKSNLKRKVSITQKAIIAFLMLGGLSFAEYKHFVLPGNYIMATADDSNQIENGANGNIIIGEGSTIRTDKSIIVGDNITTWTKSNGSRVEKTLILGNNINGINSGYSIIVGNSAGQAGGGEYNLTFGYAAGDSRYGSYTVSYGELSGHLSNGTYNFAFGKEAGRKLAGEYNIAFGYQTGQDLGESKNTFYVGTQVGSKSLGEYNVGFGYGSGQSTKGNFNFASGAQAGKNVTGDENVAIGSHAGKVVTGSANYAFGRNTGQNVTGSFNFALGDNAGQDIKAATNPESDIKGNSNFAFGKGAGSHIIGNHNVAIAENAGNYVGYRLASTDGIFETPNATNVTEYSRNTDGSNNDKGGAEHNYAMGYQAGNYIAGQDNIAIGTNTGSKIDGPNKGGASNIAIGEKSGNEIYGDKNVTLGNNTGNKIIGQNNFAIGTEAANSIKGENNIAIGFKSSNTTGNLVEKKDTISIGTEADAINNDAIAIGNKAKTTNLESITIGKSSETRGQKSITVGIKNVISSDNSGAFGNNNHISTNTNIHVIGNNNGDNTNQITAENSGIFGNNNKLSDKALNSRIIGNGNEAISKDIFIVGNNSRATGSHTVVLGNNINATESQSVYLGFNSAFNVDTTKSAGNQVYNSYELKDKNGASKGTLEFAGSTPKGIVTIGSEEGVRRLQYVAAGLISPTSTDAINGSQLYALADYVANLENQVNNATSVEVIDGKNTTVTKTPGNPTTFVVNVVGDLTDITSISNGGTKISLEKNNNININGGTIKNVAVGIEDNDAVNVSQLKELKNIVTNNINNITNIEAKLAKTELTVEEGKVKDLEDENKDKLVNSNQIKEAINNTGFFIQATGNATGTSKELVKAGEEVKLIAGDNVKISQNGQEFTFSVDIPQYDTTVTVNGDKYILVQTDGKNNFKIETNKGEINTDKPKISVENNLTGLASVEDVVVGVNALGNNTIKLGGDTGTTDTQNLNKENGLQFNVKGDGFIKTEAKGSDVIVSLSDEVKEKINNIEDKANLEVTAANSGVASAVAMANLPQVSNIAGHRHNIAGAYGYYNGEHAFALGISGLNETGNLVYKASGSLNTKGHVALGAGLGYQFDKLESRRKDMLTLQRNGNINLLDEKVYELDQEVTTLKDKVNNLEKANKELNEKLDKLIEKFMK